jgi:asparagine synthase (glutamine-hydrolysing)
LEVRGELVAKGHSFRSHTDAEVIIHAYEEWGADCVTRFNGMWALAIWDQRKREMFCSRDRFGIKPFYYYLDETVFVFASEIKGILPALETRPSADFGVLGDYLIDGTLCPARRWLQGGLGGHPKPAIEGHLKTGQRS